MKDILPQCGLDKHLEEYCEGVHMNVSIVINLSIHWRERHITKARVIAEIEAEEAIQHMARAIAEARVIA